MITARDTGAPRRRQLLLLGLLVLFLGGDLWVVLRDRRPTHNVDSAIHPTAMAYAASDLEGWLEGITVTRLKGSLVHVTSYLLALPIGDVERAVRVNNILSHGAVVVLAYRLGGVLLPGSGAGLWAALICGSSPALFGWARTDYRDMTLAALVALALLLLLRVDLRRPAQALGLGLVLALGVHTKLAFIPYMAGPGLWFLVSRARRPRALPGLALAAAAALLLLAPSLVAFSDYLLDNAVGSARWDPASGWRKTIDYLSLPGVLPLYAAALAALPLLWLRSRASRDLLRLLAVMLPVAGWFFFWHFDFTARYIVPLHVPCAVLAGGLIARAGQRLPRLPRLLGGGALALALAGGYFCLSLAQPVPGPKLWTARDGERGVFSPDPRPYDGYPRAVARINALGPALMVAGDREALEQTDNLMALRLLWTSRGLTMRRLTLEQADRRLAGGQAVPVLVFRGAGRPLEQGLQEILGWSREEDDSPYAAIAAQTGQDMRRARWLSAHRGARLIFSDADPDTLLYEVYLVPPAVAAGSL